MQCQISKKIIVRLGKNLQLHVAGAELGFTVEQQ